jgi:hypothetical protein
MEGGFEPTPFSSGKSHVPSRKRAKSDVRAALIERLLDVWPRLAVAELRQIVELAERLARDANNAR